MESRQNKTIVSRNKIIDTTHVVIAKIEALYFVSILAILSKVWSGSSAFLKASGEIFFSVAAVLKILDFLSYIASLYVALNKNAGKWTTLALKAMETFFICLAVWGGKVLGSAIIMGASIPAAPLIFTALFCFSVAYNLTWFAIHAYQAYTSEQEGDVVAEEFYRDQAGQALINIVLTGFGLTAILLSSVFPHVVLPIVITVTLFSAGLFAANVFFRGTPLGDFLQTHIVDNLKKIPVIGGAFNTLENAIGYTIDAVANAISSPSESEVTIQHIPINQNTSSDDNDVHLDDNDVPVIIEKKETSYFQNTIDLKREIRDIQAEYNSLIQDITRHKIALHKQIEAEKDGSPYKNEFWSENGKRTAKKDALGFLQTLMTTGLELYNENKTTINMQPTEISITVNGHSFNINNKLTDQINDHVVKSYNGVYQSYFKDTGEVEMLFKRAYRIIKDKNVADIEVNKERSTLRSKQSI